MSEVPDTTEDKPFDGRKITKIMKSGRKATLKFRKWFKYYLETGNATKSAILAYKCKESSAHTIGWDNLQKIDYQELMEAKGITDGMLLDRLHTGLYATKIHSSHTEPDREIEDKAVQHRYLETALKLKKRLTDAPNVLVVDKTLLLDAVPIEAEIVSTEETKSS